MALVTKFRGAFDAPVNSLPFTHDQYKDIETINKKILQTFKLKKRTNTKKLSELQEILTDFDSEIIYANIHCDLTHKYNLAKEYYKLIEKLRKNIVQKDKLEENSTGKDELIKRLDEVAPSLIKDFSSFAEEKYKLLDEIFLMKTNSHLKCNEEELLKRMDEVLVRPEIIYNQEFEKMCRIHDILEDEEKRLLKLK